MKGYFQLTLAQLRLFARNRQVLFWTLVFPIVLMLMLGLFLGNENGISLSGTLIDQDQTEASRTLTTALKQQAVVEFDEGSDREKALNLLKKGDLQLVMIIPQGYSDNINSTESEAQLELFYDETIMTTSQVGRFVISQIVDGVSKQITGYQPAVTVNEQGVQALHLKYIDFLVPGIVALMIMSNSLNGVAGQIASWRERGVLRRMQSTPLIASTFIAAQITARLLLNGSQAIITLLIANLAFGTQVNGSWLLLLMLVIMGTLTFMAIGFIIAGLAKTPESASPIAGFVSFPMLFLGGVFFPISNMPDFLQPIVNALPIAHLSTALRQIMNVGADLSMIWGQAALLGAWMIASFIVSSYSFKWE